jgi:hypothetical protein
MMAYHEPRLDGDSGVANEADAAELIATMTAELAQLARRHGLHALGYVLDMARLEADNTAHGLDRQRAAS